MGSPPLSGVCKVYLIIYSTKKLHDFLKKWPTTQNTTTVAIGNFYLAIDKNLREKGGRPDDLLKE